jgi:hypothetical protein
MLNLSYIVDPFCEESFWKGEHINTVPISNPVSAGTGLVIVLMVLFTHNIRFDANHPPATGSTTIFSLCRASLGIVGAGTVLFHSLDDQSNALNSRLCDWLPIVLMCTNIFVLYFTKLSKLNGERTQTLIFMVMYIWMCVLILAADSTTYEWMTLKIDNLKSGQQSMYGTIMNIVLLAPLGFVLLYASLKKFRWIHSAILWGLIIINLLLWVLNAYLCRDNLWMFIFHAAYHVSIAYTFLYATCLGMTLDDKWELAPSKRLWALWPMVQPVVSADTDCEAAISESELRNDATRLGREMAIMVSSLTFCFDIALLLTVPMHRQQRSLLMLRLKA